VLDTDPATCAKAAAEQRRKKANNAVFVIFMGALSNLPGLNGANAVPF
jgi:hypothetical protein